MALKIAGLFFMVFGLVDMLGSWGNLDVWLDWFKVEMSKTIRFLTAYIEIAIGYTFLKFSESKS